MSVFTACIDRQALLILNYYEYVSRQRLIILLV